MSDSLFERRRAESLERVEQVRQSLSLQLAPIEHSFSNPAACIFATGSIAREESTKNSDLDAFFFLSGTSSDQPLSRIRDVKILNAVVLATEQAGFPDFSNDGEYLKFLHIEDVKRHIGGREDDYHNALTARMLMILESKFLYNEALYKDFRKQLVEAYFEDFHDHSRSFRPIFLLNDVLRFWRTMCLNYENGRQWRNETVEKSAKGHLANLKLKFSRLNICFSFVTHLLSKGPSLSPDDVIETSAMTPIIRLHDLRDRFPDVGDRVSVMLDDYEWFLNATGPEKDVVLSWISSEHNRIEAFSNAERFVENMAQLVRAISDKNGYLRYLLI